MKLPLLSAALIAALLAWAPAHADAQEPFIWVRGEAGASLGLNGPPSDAGVGGHIAGEAMVYVVHPLAIAVRAGGSYFSPFQAKPDALHASWSGGLVLRLDLAIVGRRLRPALLPAQRCAILGRGNARRTRSP